MVDLLLALGSVILINIVLSGDNAVVIALASRNLPDKQRKKAIFWGSAVAVALRIGLVIIATLLMRVPYLQGIGGLALIYIGYHLLASDEEEENIEGNSGLMAAIRTIIIADLIMSLDNVLAIAGVAKGDWLVLIIGLAISIPLVIFGATLLSILMKRFPIIVYIGAGLIAYTAAEMITSDVKLTNYLEPYAIIIKIVVTVGVLAAGFLTKRYKKKSKDKKKEKDQEKKSKAKKKEKETKAHKSK